MKKFAVRIIALFAIMLLFTSQVSALTINTGNTTGSSNNTQNSNTVVPSVTTLELVEKKLCKIDLKDSTTNEVVGEFTKELTDFNASKKEATLTLTLKSLMKQEVNKKPVEVYLVLDNSFSMTKSYNGKSKSDYVAETASVFVNSLFEHFENAKIGIVSFSCVEPVGSQNEDFHDGTKDDAKLVLPLSNSKEAVNAKISEYKTGERGQHTNIEAGLALAEDNFSESTESEKYIILLSDGVPNLCLDTETTLQYSGKIATNTKNKLKTMEESGFHIYSVLMNFYEADVENPMAPVVESTGKHMTYGELTGEIFGTTQNPTVGKFFYIDYNKLNDTINTDIYTDITAVKDTALKDIVIKDYFPKEIVDNFNFEYVKSPNIGQVSEKIDTTDNSITWKVEVLNAEEVATLSYKLTLKDNYDKSIVDKVLPTNSKVDIDYSYNNVKENNSSTDSSTVRVKYLESSKDDTVAKDPIPQTGIHTTMLFTVIATMAITFAIIKVFQIKGLK